MNTLSFQRKQKQAELVYTGTPCTRGHNSPRYGRFGGCVECVRENNVKRGNVSEYNKQWWQKNREYCNAAAVHYRKNNREQNLVNVCRKVAKDKGLSFNITATDIVIPAKCPVLGIDLYYSSNKRTDNTPSVDRIVPGKGYVKGNILVVSWRANRIKNDATPEELQKLAVFYRGM